ncbi:ATP-binding protein [Paracidovorax anthurii]|uniref:histidine kinase n=1 Tax=Paracidovorax anthurii TaxID=78229 RepID=A0A328ZI91_9BURK|nr:ATP-binding protein [Paracidovorax anthurii]RAR84943.1 signal transduction histidine kinase [Paracidovorax anthurii]
MPSTPLSDTLRTSHFRTATYFLAVFALSSAALLGYVYWKTSFYLAHEVDLELQTKAQRWSQLPPEVLLREVEGQLRRDPSRREPAMLIGAGGERVAGAFDLAEPIPRYDQPFDAAQRDPHGHRIPVRALATVLGSGLVLLLGHDVHELKEFNERIRTAMAGGIVIVLGMGLVGALVLGSRAQRRLDAMAHSLQRIVEGHLDARLPVRNTRDDLDRIAALVNSMLDDMQRLMGEVKGVTDDVAHDLRTPLTRMLSGLERAQTVALSREELSALVDDTASDARLLLRMFKGLLRISEIENSARRENFETVDLARIAADAVDLFEPAAQELGIALRFEGAGAPLQGDPDLLFDAFANLIDNAIKFAPAGTGVTVRVVHEADHLQAVVTDAGPGIPESEREAVLRRFYRSERSRNTPGHGPGLSLVAAVARLHGMALTIGDARPGCRVALTLRTGPLT